MVSYNPNHTAGMIHVDAQGHGNGRRLYLLSDRGRLVAAVAFQYDAAGSIVNYEEALANADRLAMCWNTAVLAELDVSRRMERG